MKKRDENSYSKIAFNRYGLLRMEYEDTIYEVWRVEDIIDTREILLCQFKKRIFSYREQDVFQFKKDMDILTKSNNPYILKVLGVGEYNNWLYTLHDIIDGARLSVYLKAAYKFELSCIIDIIKSVATALSCAHKNNIVHGTIEPDKIWLNIEAQKLKHLKVTGFGIFPFLDLTTVSDPGDVLKIVSYLSPEAVGIINSPINKVSDIYSLGVLFYQLCTGELPFFDDTVEGLVHKHIANSFIPPSEINADIPGDIDSIMARLLQKDQDKRYEDIDAFLSELENIKQNLFNKSHNQNELSFNTSFIGRRNEINIIKKGIKEASGLRGQVLMISGESGSGKTRLIDEVIGQLDTGYLCTLLCRCFPGENKSPFSTIHDAFEQFYAYFTRLDENEQKRENLRLNESVGNFGQIILQVNNNLQPIVGQAQSLVKLDPDKENERFYEVCTHFICSLGVRGRPCVLFIDDLQWIDEGSLRILNEVGMRIHKYPLLIVGTYRIEDISSGHLLQSMLNNHQNISLIKIENLHYTQLRLLLMELLCSKPESVLDELTGYIMNQSKGNPFFSIQLVKHLYENGVVHKKNGSWNLDWNKVDVHNIPGTLIDSILKRINLLSQKEKELLAIGAVAGTSFSPALLQEISKEDSTFIDKSLDKAFQLQLIESGIPIFQNISFIHDKIHDAFYHTIDEKNKREIHEGIARYFENHRLDDDKNIFFIAHHYIKSQNRKKSLEYAFKAGTVAMQKYAHEEAIQYFKIVIKNLEADSRKGMTLWLEANAYLVDIYLLKGLSDKAIKIVQSVLPHIKNKFTKAEYFCTLATAFNRKGDFKKCEEYGKAGLKLLGEYLPVSKKSVLLGLFKEIIVHGLHGLLSFLYPRKPKFKMRKYELICKFYSVLTWTYVLSDLTKFVRSMLRMLNLAEAKLWKSKQLAFSYHGYAGLCMSIPLFKRGLSFINKALEIRKELNDEHGIAQTLQLTGFCYEWMGLYDKAVFSFEKAKDRFLRIGDMKEYGRSVLGLVEVYYLMAKYEKALEMLEEYYKVASKSKDNYALSNAYDTFFKIYYEKGNFKTAEKNLIKGHEISKKNKINIIYCISLIDSGRFQLEMGNIPKALFFLNKAEVVNKININIPHYIVYLYNIMTDAAIKNYMKKIYTRNRDRKIDLSRIKIACSRALRKSKMWPAHYGGALREAAKYYGISKKHIKAHQFFKASITHCMKFNRKYELAKCYYEYGKYMKIIGEDTSAIEYLTQASLIFKEIGAENFIKETEKSLHSHEETVSFLEKFKDKIRLASIINVSQKISSILNVQKLLDTILKEAISITGATCGAFYILDEKEKDLRLKASLTINKNDDWNQLAIFRKDIARIVFDSGKKMFATDMWKFKTEKQWRHIHIEAIQSMICLPMRLHKKKIGVFYMDSDQSRSVFSEDDVQLLSVFLSQAAISMENAQLYNELGEKVEERTLQLHRTMKELEISNKDLQHFVYIVSHDLKEPLRMVSGFLQLLSKRYNDKLDNNANDFINFAVDGANRMTIMIEDLLKYSRVGRVQKEMEEVDCDEVLDDTIKNLTVLLEEKKAKIIRGRLPVVLGYKTLLIQLFQNLIVNAVKFCDSEIPVIHIKSVNKDTEWCFQVDDNGIGIEEEFREKIFQIFKRIDPENKYSGTGIGLALCKKIVEQHGGTIWVESEIGKGSTFNFTIQKTVKNIHG